jgi:hypothetical protein
MLKRPARPKNTGPAFLFFENRSLLIRDKPAGRLILKELYTWKYIVIILIKRTPAFFVKDLGRRQKSGILVPDPFPTRF